MRESVFNKLYLCSNIRYFELVYYSTLGRSAWLSFLETDFVILHFFLSSNVIWASISCEFQQWFKISICFDAVNRTYWLGEDVRIEILPPAIFLIPNFTWLVKSNIRLSWDAWHLHLLGIMFRPRKDVLVKRRKLLGKLLLKNKLFFHQALHLTNSSALMLNAVFHIDHAYKSYLNFLPIILDIR